MDFAIEFSQSAGNVELVRQILYISPLMDMVIISGHLNLKVKKIGEMTQIFRMELFSKMVLEFSNPIRIITSDYYIIHIEEDSNAY